MHVLGIAGSLRTGSWNRKVLLACIGLVPEGLVIEPHPLNGIPLYNGDVEEAGMPPGVAALKERIVAADGILFVTPEYNHGTPGVLKNAIDWGTRQGNSWGDKPVAICGATPGRGGTVRSQEQLRQTCHTIGMLVMPGPEVFISQVDKLFDAGGGLTDERTNESLRKMLMALKVWVERLQHASPSF